MGKIFFNVKEWFDYMKGQDWVFGTRLHGAVAALLRNVPAIVICIDARTKELCDLMDFPMSIYWRQKNVDRTDI